MNTILTIFLYILLIVSNPIVEAIKITHNPPNTPPPTNICSGTYSDYLQMNKIPPPARTTNPSPNPPRQRRMIGIENYLSEQNEQP